MSSTHRTPISLTTMVYISSNHLNHPQKGSYKCISIGADDKRILCICVSYIQSGNLQGTSSLWLSATTGPLVWVGGSIQLHSDATGQAFALNMDMVSCAELHEKYLFHHCNSSGALKNINIERIPLATT